MKIIIFFVLGIAVLFSAVPKASAAVSGTFDFTSTSLTRGQDNTLTFTVTNNGTSAISAIALGFPTGSGTELKSPSDMDVINGTNSGPWYVAILHGVPILGSNVPFFPTTTQTDYTGFAWGMSDENGRAIPGSTSLARGKAETFTAKIFVPTTYTQNSLTADAVVIRPAGRNSQILEHDISFTVSDPAPSTSTEATTTVSTLPQTGADIPSSHNSWYGLAIFIFPLLFVFKLR